nr:retrovirus-related Pol polyprotein from transposon TNT 1-94 [Tanacetum cinerariifolium]
MAYFVAILTPDIAWSCVMQHTFPTERMRSIISMVSISLEGFLPSILLLVVIIVVVVIVVVILVVVVIDAVVGVVIIVARIGFPLFTTGISLGPVFLLGLLAFAMAAACTSKATATPSVIAGVADSGVVDLTGDEDPSDEDGGTGMGDSIGVSVSLGKFNGKANERFFVGYSMNSKAFRVFNSRKRIMEENLHIRFSENTPNVIGIQSNGFVGTKARDNADDGFQPSSDSVKKVDEDPSKGSDCRDQEQDNNVNNTKKVNAASTNKVNAVSENISNELPFDPNVPTLEDISAFNFSIDHEDNDEEVD